MYSVSARKNQRTSAFPQNASIYTTLAGLVGTVAQKRPERTNAHDQARTELEDEESTPTPDPLTAAPCVAAVSN